MKNYIKPEVNTSLCAKEEIALNQITINGDFEGTSTWTQEIGDTQW